MAWKPLPDTLSPEGARFVTRLRELKDGAGVSLSVLAERTAYSRSSWDRCLNGRALPPRQAVEGLCRLAGQQPGPLLALRELAELTWGGRPSGDVPPAAAEEETPSASAPERTGDGRRRYPLRMVVVTAVLVAAATLPLAWWLAAAVGGGSATPRPTAAVSTTRALCTGRSCQGEDPRATWCSSGSETVAKRRTDSGVWFEVRYRRACRAAWGRMWFSRPGDRLVVTLAGEQREVGDTDPAKTDGYHTTPMLTTDTPRRVSACYVPERGPKTCIVG